MDEIAFTVFNLSESTYGDLRVNNIFITFDALDSPDAKALKDLLDCASFVHGCMLSYVTHMHMSAVERSDTKIHIYVTTL